ncbi:9635_t:CDS:1, partial [Diversispora eburnea]
KKKSKECSNSVVGGVGVGGIDSAFNICKSGNISDIGDIGVKVGPVYQEVE